MVYSTIKLYCDTNQIKHLDNLLNFHNEMLFIRNLSQFLQSYTIADKNISMIYTDFFNRYNVHIYSKQYFYERFRFLGYRYKSIKNKLKDQKHIEEKRIFYLDNLSKSISQTSRCTLFFDSSTITEGNFKKRGWSLVNTNTTMNKKFSYNKTHILALTSDTHLHAI